MKIFYSKVERQSNRLRLTVDDTGFMLEQAPIQYALHGVVEMQDRLPAAFDPLLTYDVRFSDITQRADFSDHAAYNLSSGTKVRPLFNFWKYTLAARLTGEEFARSAGINSAACLIIPFKDSPISDWVLGLHISSQDILELVNATAVAHLADAAGGLSSLRQIMSPSVAFDSSLATVTPEGLVTLGYRVLNPDGSLHSGAAEIYFETTGGYLPLARSATNGQGILSIKAQNMTPGQRFKVKAGFKYYPGKTECLITVV